MSKERLQEIAKELANNANMPYCWEDIYNRLIGGYPLPFKVEVKQRKTIEKGANMFEPKTKAITRWGLTIRGTDVFFPKKETTIKIGRLTLKMNPETRMFEEYRLWDLTSGVPELIDEQRFDRTILIQ